MSAELTTEILEDLETVVRVFCDGGPLTFGEQTAYFRSMKTYAPALVEAAIEGAKWKEIVVQSVGGQCVAGCTSLGHMDNCQSTRWALQLRRLRQENARLREKVGDRWCSHWKHEVGCQCENDT